MKKQKLKPVWIIIFSVAVVLLMSIIVVRNGIHDEQIIGGERDSHGCLTPAGYSWNESLQVCLREWEISGNDRQILEYALNYTTREYSLTVLNITKGDCNGCFTVWFNSVNRTKSVDVIEAKTYCSEEQRGPGIYCIQVYEPVCGSDNRIYSNGCIACLNSSVEYYTEGECQ